MAKDVTKRIAELKGTLANTLEQKAKTEDRKRDTRRKIIVGGAILVEMQKQPAFAQIMAQMLSATVGRQSDREAIADLLALATQSPAQQKPAPQPDPANPENQIARVFGRASE